MNSCLCGCGTELPEGRRYVHSHNMLKHGEGHPNWRGGKSTLRNGYVHVRLSGNKYVLEHVLIAEAALGHALPSGAQVHHVNGEPGDNRNGNLIICQDQKYHQLLHRRARALAEHGDPSALRCCFCGSYKRQDLFTVAKHGATYHKPCKVAANRGRKINIDDLYDPNEKAA